MTITVAKLLKGLILEDATSYVNRIDDAIDGLSNINTKVVDSENIVEYIDVDANTITVLNADGTVASGSIANSSDKTFKTVEFSIPAPYIKQLKIGRTEFKKFGITAEDLDVNAKRFGIERLNALVSSGALADELKKMYNDFYQFSRNQVHTLLASLSNATATYQKTADGDYLVANSRTGHLYDFDNLGTAGLSETEFKIGLNAIAKQVDARGNEIGSKAPQFLFHTSNLTLANEILKPNEVVNANYRSAGDFKISSGVKFAGVYNNGSDTNDWILLAEGHKIQRYVMAGYETPQVRITHDTLNDIIVIEMSTRSIMKCTSPECIYAGVVA